MKYLLYAHSFNEEIYNLNNRISDITVENDNLNMSLSLILSIKRYKFINSIANKNGKVRGRK